MDALLADSHLPPLAVLQGPVPAALMGGAEAGWRARLTLFEAPPQVAPGVPVLERVELEVWWMAGESRRSLGLEGFRRRTLGPGDIP